MNKTCNLLFLLLLCSGGILNAMELTSHDYAPSGDLPWSVSSIESLVHFFEPVSPDQDAPPAVYVEKSPAQAPAEVTPLRKEQFDALSELSYAKRRIMFGELWKNALRMEDKKEAVLALQSLLDLESTTNYALYLHTLLHKYPTTLSMTAILIDFAGIEPDPIKRSYVFTALRDKHWDMPPDDTQAQYLMRSLAMRFNHCIGSGTSDLA